MVTENYLYEMLYCNRAFYYGFDLDNGRREKNRD